MKTDDPVRDAAMRDYEFERWLEKRPVCACCGEHIQDETAVFIDNEWICNDCIDEKRRYIDE